MAFNYIQTDNDFPKIEWDQNSFQDTQAKSIPTPKECNPQNTTIFL